MSACCDVTPLLPEREARQWLRLGLAAFVAGQSMVFGLAVNLSPPEGPARTWIHALLAGSAVAVFLLAGWPIARAAWEAARGRRITMEQLFLAGIAGAFGASVQASLTGRGAIYYEVVAVLVAIYTLGNVLVRRQRGAALQLAEELGREFGTARRQTPGGAWREVDAAEIAPGDRVLVRPGEGIPADGRVAEGVAFVREAAMTGEPSPVVKRPGDAVMAGSYVLDEALVLVAERGGRDRQIDGLLARVRAARLRPGRLQDEADRLVAWFFPAVMVLAVLVAVFWTWRESWESGVMRGLSVLLVACPCAMGLATPIGLWSALGAMARRGLEARGGDAVERLAAADVAVFDKTGTLSEEQLRLVDFVVVPGADREELKALARAVQARANHPVARAFDAGPETAPDRPIDRVVALPGTGVRAHLPGDRVFEIGNADLLGDADQEIAAALRTQARGDEGAHAVYLKEGGRLVGLAILREALRGTAADAARALRTLGLETMVMTGDRGPGAAAGAFDDIRAGLDPSAKAAAVAALRDGGRKVLFVGDGINDAPALAAAHAGVALASGAGLAGESAHAILHGEDLRVLPEAVALCRATLRAIRSNLLLAACYNAAGITLAACGVLHPVVSALLMLGSSLTVTWRALHRAERLRAGTEPLPPA